MRNQYLPWMVCAAIAGVATPALASGPESRAANAHVDTYDNYFKDLVDGDTRADIAPGETVYFRSPQEPEPTQRDVPRRAAAVRLQPTKQSPGNTDPPDTDGVPPMPANPLPQGWEGYCTFTAPGTYEFYCQAHGGMDGTVVVSGTPNATATATSTPTATATATATATSTPPPATNPAPAPTAAPQAPAPTPVAASPKPKLSSATFKRSKRTVSVAGTLAASGKVRVALSYRTTGTKLRKKTLSLAVRNGRFSGMLKLSAADARRAKQLSVTVTFAGETAKRTVKVSR